MMGSRFKWTRVQRCHPVRFESVEIGPWMWCVRTLRGCGYSLQVWRKSNGGHEVRSFFDLTAETEDGVLLEALTDIQDVLVLERDEAHLLQPSLGRFLDQTHHRLRGNRDKNGRERLRRAEREREIDR